MNIKAEKKKAWKWFSLFIRLRDCDEWKFTTCITCTHRAQWRTFDAGHFLPKKVYEGVWFNETNVHAQCGRCNLNQGNHAVYRTVMIKRYGQQHVDLLEFQGKNYTKKSAEEYRIMTEYYKQKAIELAKEKGCEI